MPDVGVSSFRQRIAHSDIGHIIFVHRGKEFFAFNIVASCFIKHQAVSKSTQIMVNSLRIYFAHV